MKIQTNAKQEEAETGALSGFMGKVSGLLGDNEEQKEAEAKENLVAGLGKMLNNNFTLLRGFPIPNTEVEVPMILIGPAGVKVIYPFTQPGIYRASNDKWLEMNERKQKFEPATENIVGKTFAMAQGIHKFLQDCGVKLDDVEPVMLLSDPGSHVDTDNSVVKVVSRDGIRNFVGAMIQKSQIFKSDDVFNIASLLSRPLLAKQQLAKARGEVLPLSAADSAELFPGHGASDPDDNRPDWMKAIDEPEPEELKVVEKKDVITPELIASISNFSPEDFIQKLGFSTVQWVLLLIFAGTICLTSLVAFLLIFIA